MQTLCTRQLQGEFRRHVGHVLRTDDFIGMLSQRR